MGLTEKGDLLTIISLQVPLFIGIKVLADSNIRKLDSKSFHFICPKCKSHFVIDNNNGEVFISISQSRNKRYNESTELMQLRGEVNELSEEMEKIKCKWWYKSFKKYEYCGYAAIFRMIDGRRLIDGWKIRPCGAVSSSHYAVNSVSVTAMLGDMVDFFTY